MYTQKLLFHYAMYIEGLVWYFIERSFLYTSWYDLKYKEQREEGCTWICLVRIFQRKFI